jgi:eukaryotic-like serine/threonine-protein kinase
LTLRSVLRFVARNLVLGVALLATLATSATLTMRVVLSARDVAVPGLVGMALRSASTLAGRRGLELRVEGRRYDASVPADHVLVQEPPAGATLKAHRSVRVWVSLGSRRINVPPVEGQSARTARVALEQAGLPVAHVVEVAGATPEGTVLVQRPPPGETDAAETTASLLVSRGPGRDDFVMPDLIGRPAEDVISWLQSSGFKVTDVRYRSYPGVAPGVVLRQAPAAGHPVNRRTALALDVSRGQP